MRDTLIPVRFCEAELRVKLFLFFYPQRVQAYGVMANETHGALHIFHRGGVESGRLPYGGAPHITA